MKIVVALDVVREGLSTPGDSARLLELAASGRFQLAASSGLAADYRSLNLFPRDSRRRLLAAQAIELLLSRAAFFEPRERFSSNCLDAAVASNAHFLATFDSSMLALVQVRRTKLLTPASVLQRL